MQQCSHVSGAPIVSKLYVDGQVVVITCRRDYMAAKRDYRAEVRKTQATIARKERLPREQVANVM